MTSSNIVEDARVAHVRELKTEIAALKARVVQAEADRTALGSHLHLAMMALHDFERLTTGENFRIIDGWNAILRRRNVSKLTAEQVSELKEAYLAGLGIEEPRKKTSDDTADVQQPTADCQLSTSVWIVFDGPAENSYRSGHYRVTYTGGTGQHRADRLILDYVHAAKLIGLDVSRIIVETGDKAIRRRISALGSCVQEPASLRETNAEKVSDDSDDVSIV